MTEIEITCSCGARGVGQPGDMARCDECGRIVEVPGVPDERLAQIALTGRTHRLLQVVSLCASVALFVLVAAAIDAGAIAFAAPAGVLVWVAMIRPFLARRRDQRLASLAAWNAS